MQEASGTISTPTCKVLGQYTGIIKHHAQELLCCVLHVTNTKNRIKEL